MTHKLIVFRGWRRGRGDMYVINMCIYYLYIYIYMNDCISHLFRLYIVMFHLFTNTIKICICLGGRPREVPLKCEKDMELMRSQCRMYLKICQTMICIALNIWIWPWFNCSHYACCRKCVLPGRPGRRTSEMLKIQMFGSRRVYHGFKQLPHAKSMQKDAKCI